MCRPVSIAALLLAACLAGCRSSQSRTDDLFVDGGLSFLPQVGVAAGVGMVVRRSESADYALEVEGTYQFIDDQDLIDDGNPEQGPWYQVRLGVKQVFAPQSRRHFVLRYGIVWFEQTGITGIIDRPGNYGGGYVGIGFETDISSRVSVGPELRFIAANGEGDIGWVFVPQLALHVTFRF